MVEYAILLILLVTLFVGGTELGLTALASNKNTEAAKTGISEYAQVNQQRLNILNAEKQYMTTLAGYGCSVIYEITNDYDETNDVYLKADGVSSTTFSRESMNADLSEYTCTKPSDTQADAGISAAIVYSSIVQLLDEVYIGDSTVYTSLSDVADTLLELANYRDTVTTGLNSASEIIKGLDENGNGVLTIAELADGESVLLDAYVGSEISDAEVRKLEAQLKYRALLLISHYKLSQLPLLTDTDSDNIDDVFLSQAAIKIGDHDTGITPASCNGNNYNYGFPNGRYPYNNDDDEDTYVKTSGGQIYLFHPLPIDVDSCLGTDDTRGGRSRLRILIDGFGNPTDADGDGVIDDPLFVPGLPKLNQAMYSNYENVCVDANNSYVSCSSSNVAQRWLKPPGKICFNNTEVAGVDSCIGHPNTTLEAFDSSYGPTGFYFFANANDSSTGSFEYTQNDSDRDNDGSVDFSPTLQLECSSTANKNSDSVFDTSCTTIHTKVRIHTLYRRVFEGFLTFGLQTLTQPALLPYFYNPNQVGVADHVVIGSHGSEVGPLGRGGNPTIKQFMDFRGCYEVDVETNQVSACN